MGQILNENLLVGVVIIQPINDYRDKYMVPINSESFKTPNLTPQTLPKSKLNIFFLFSKISLVQSWLKVLEQGHGTQAAFCLSLCLLIAFEQVGFLLLPPPPLPTMWPFTGE